MGTNNNVGLQIGNRFYNCILTDEQVADVHLHKMSSAVTQEILLNPDYNQMGPDIPHEQWTVSILYSFGIKEDGVSKCYLYLK